MIGKLKKRFIILAMVSLAALLTVIVAGMNIANYQKVVNDADNRLEVLEDGAGRILGGAGQPGAGMPVPAGDPEDMDIDDGDYPDDPKDIDYDDLTDDWNDIFDDMDMDEVLGPGKSGGPYMTRDEAEESRFFMVVIDEDGKVLQTNIDRISSVDASEAEAMAQKALASGKEEGFEGDFRFSVDDDGPGYVITFLDCGRTLESFRSFLMASIVASLAGLLLIFFVILYFAGRIVRPVAESYEKQKRFITDAGHEIKTPLAIIKANIDLMDMELDSKRIDRAELRDDLKDINDQVDRLTDLTNDLVYLSRMEESENSLVMTDLPLSDIVEETAESFEPLAWDSGKAIAADIEPDISVKGSRKEIEKLLSILLENALKYSVPPRSISLGELEDGMPVLPEIDLILKKEGRNAVLEVRNETESELSNEQLSHVFERFYRTDSSRNSETGGHGIGLSVAAAIVNAHGGKITARTSTGHDFMVTVSLPMQ
ncbi:MAG: HAMP domain-containing histidine kinase [Mogibacterium sp.]|nr:HAMP domain-containing histidine kinase [Mogibacterium sp.]